MPSGPGRLLRPVLPLPHGCFWCWSLRFDVCDGAGEPGEQGAGSKGWSTGFAYRDPQIGFLVLYGPSSASKYLMTWGGDTGALAGSEACHVHSLAALWLELAQSFLEKKNKKNKNQKNQTDKSCYCAAKALSGRRGLCVSCVLHEVTGLAKAASCLINVKACAWGRFA